MTNRTKAENLLNELCKVYSKQDANSMYYIRSESKCSYSPENVEIVFERGKFFPQRFIKINIHEENCPASTKFGRFELLIFLYPLVKCYGEDTRNHNGTIQQYFKELPTIEEIEKLRDNKFTTFHS